MDNVGKNVPKVRHLVVKPDSEGQRIDNFLLARLKGVPKSWVYRVLRRGEVRVNKGRVKPTRRLQVGDEVRIPPLRMSEKSGGPGPGAGLRKLIGESVIHRDDDLIIVNKPSGVAVHGGSGISFGVIEVLRAINPDAPYLELAHRLDRDTSGCLLLATRRPALQQFQKLQLSGKVNKRYLALLKGRWRRDRVTVDAPLRKNELQSGERVVRVDPQGKPSVTDFRVLQRFPGAMLVEARLQTGRTHQIRVHAAHLGTPILGDEKYGDEEANRKFRELGLKRLFLHAWKLEFPWRERRGGYRFEAPLPAALEQLLEKLS